MASSLQFLLLFSLIPLINSSLFHQPTSQNALILPLTKDPSTHQYLTHLYMGTIPMAPTKVVVDLSGPILWIDCSSRHVSSSHFPIPSNALQCSRAKANGRCGYGKSCSLHTVNTITRVAAPGDLAEDIVAVGGVDRSDRVGSIATVDQFLFSCAPQLLLHGLPSGVKGMLGLGRGRISLPSQIASNFGIHRKFAACLSSGDGFIISGDWVPFLRSHVSNSLMYTPLISNKEDNTLRDYYINVRSIKVHGKRLSLNTSKLAMDQKGNGGTKVSTIVPYTTMESTIYETFTKAYIMVATTAMNMTRVASVAPFGVCFSSIGIHKTRAGAPEVPMIDLVMQSEMVKWRMRGRNSMVEVGDEVMCLGFLDGGLSPKASIVIGGYQLEDTLLEFNLATSMFGFSSSLSMREISCSDFNKVYSMPSDESLLL